MKKVLDSLMAMVMILFLCSLGGISWAATASAQAAPDGYTLGMGTTTMTCVVEWEIANNLLTARSTSFTIIPI